MTRKLREDNRRDRLERKVATGGTWQAHKSANMRRTILDAAMNAVVDHGYARVTTQIIVERAGVSRGAMLHHFPKKQDLLAALVRHIFDRRSMEFETELSKLSETQRRDEIKALDIYWEQSSQPSFLAMIELSIAARTDDQLAAAFNPVFAEIAAGSYSKQLTRFPEWDGNVKAFEAAADLVRCLMVGLAVVHDVGTSPERRDTVLAITKKAIAGLQKDHIPA